MSQLRIIGGAANVTVTVRSSAFEVFVGKEQKGWRWSVLSTYGERDFFGPHEKTWALAFRRAMRKADALAPRKKR